MKKLYAIAIDTIDHSYQGVQMGHAVGKLASKHPEVDWDNQTFVYLKSGELKLHKLMHQLTTEGKDFSAFYEPDIGNKLTAIACLTDNYKPFKSFNLF
jgi:hypothetical protein